MLTLLVVFFFFVHVTISENCVIDNRFQITAWDKKLRKDLISCYNRHLPPNVNNTLVSIKFLLKTFYFDNKEEVFTIDSWLFLNWNDPRFTWVPDDYDGITEVTLSSTKLWTPNLKHYSTSGNDDEDHFVTTCRVKSTGSVSCRPDLVHQTTCSSILTDWPYDKQQCGFIFGSSTKNDNFTFDVNSSPLVQIAGGGKAWTIIDYSSGEATKSPGQFYFYLVLERHGVGLAAVVIVPTLVLSILTMLSMCLNVEDKTRLSILCYGLLNQFFFLQEINSDIPKNSADTPTVLIYIRTSIVLMLVAIGITVILNKLLDRTAHPPNFMVTLNGKLLEPYGKYLIYPRWTTAKGNRNNEEGSTENASVWTDFASIINFIALLIMAIVYFTMFVIYVPKK